MLVVERMTGRGSIPPKEGFKIREGAAGTGHTARIKALRHRRCEIKGCPPIPPPGMGDMDVDGMLAVFIADFADV
jgi:hypothetical protein